MFKKAAPTILLTILVSACNDDKTSKAVSAPAKPEQNYVKASEMKPAFISNKFVEVEPCSLDAINESPAKENNRINNKSQVTLAGWAANVPNGVAATEIWLEFSGSKYFYLKAAVKEQRPDVASHFNKPAMLDSGWRAFADLGILSAGDYKVRILMPDMAGYSVCDTKRQFRVE
jgi:hypothetical protein